MAPKRPIENPQPVSSSQEEEEEELSEENDVAEEDDDQDLVEEDDDQDLVEEEEEVEESPLKKSTVQTNSPSHSIYDTDADSDSDKSLQSPNVSDFTIKPIPSKPIAEPTKPTKKSASKSGSKRAAESELTGADSKTESKKKKKLSSGYDDEDVKKGSGTQRLWSEADEIVILKGMSEYKSETGTDPNADMGAFHDFIKKSLHVDVSKNQLMDKIRRLKKKYRNNAEKGEDLVLFKPHEHKSFQLSKKIWSSSAANDSIINNNNGTSISKKKAKQRQSSGSNKNTNTNDIVDIIKPITLGLPRQDARTKKQHQVVVSGGPKENVEAEKVEANGAEEKGDLDEFWSDYPYLKESLEIEKPFALPDFSKRILRERMPAIGRDKAKEMNNKWRKLRLEETELFLKKHELIQEHAEFVLDAIKSSSS